MINFFLKLNSEIFVKIDKYQPIIKKGNLSGQSKIFLKDNLVRGQNFYLYKKLALA